MHLRFILTGSLAVVCVVGCATTPIPTDEAKQRQMLELLMPTGIEIVEPFTRVTSFDNDAIPDGIEVLLQAVNSLGHRGQIVAGYIRVELFEHVPASGDKKGRRFQYWEVALTTVQEQKRHWNEITQMYELLLQVDPEPITPADKYILAVTYSSPLGEHLTDECLITHRTPETSLGRAPSRR